MFFNTTYHYGEIGEWKLATSLLSSPFFPTLFPSEQWNCERGFSRVKPEWLNVRLSVCLSVRGLASLLEVLALWPLLPKLLGIFPRCALYIENFWMGAAILNWKILFSLFEEIRGRTLLPIWKLIKNEGEKVIQVFWYDLSLRSN